MLADAHISSLSYLYLNVYGFLEWWIISLEANLKDGD